MNKKQEHRHHSKSDEVKDVWREQHHVQSGQFHDAGHSPEQRAINYQTDPGSCFPPRYDGHSRQQTERMQQQHVQSGQFHDAGYPPEQRAINYQTDPGSQSSKRDACVTSSCHRCQQNALQYKNSMAEMEEHYKEKLKEARSALKESEEEFKSFKDRVASEMSLSIKTGDSENMNNPVNKTRLKEMYDQLRIIQWPKIKGQLKSEDDNIKSAKRLIQCMFEDAREQMEKKKQHIEEMFDLNKHSRGSTPQKVTEYKLSTVQNLQMALYYSRKEDIVKTPFLEHKAHLAAECYWLGCLMALNNPPLQPDWKKHVPGLDAWDIFPSDIKCVSDKENEPMEQ
ncbi:uncharacterized protein [Centroberyx affinis]|uniref:uncharacterized protein isoform X2 n=1 Tax=Centroberyx affinis TaxID=166261 RepID=UPI003A5BB19B